MHMNRRIKKKYMKRFGTSHYACEYIRVYGSLNVYDMVDMYAWHIMDIKPNDTWWTHMIRRRRYHIKDVSPFKYQQIGGYDYWNHFRTTCVNFRCCAADVGEDQMWSDNNGV